MLQNFDIAMIRGSVIQCGAGKFSPKSSENIFQSSPFRSMYVMYLMDSNSDVYSASMTVVMYATSCDIGSH